MEWEYKTYTLKASNSFWGGRFDNASLDSVLNEFGEDGWELVNTVASNRGYGETGYVIFIFKREKRD